MSRPLLILEATTPIGRALVDQALRQGMPVTVRLPRGQTEGARDGR